MTREERIAKFNEELQEFLQNVPEGWTVKHDGDESSRAVSYTRTHEVCPSCCRNGVSPEWRDPETNKTGYYEFGLHKYVVCGLCQGTGVHNITFIIHHERRNEDDIYFRH